MTAQSAPPDLQRVRGERAEAVVNAAATVQSKVSGALAAGLMTVLGVGALSWYYAHALTQQTRARAAAHSTALSRAQGEMPLPPLGRIDPPGIPGSPARADAAAPLATASMPALPLEQARGGAGPLGGGAVVPLATQLPSPTSRTKTSAELARERRLAGAVFSRESNSAAGQPVASEPAVAAAAAASLSTAVALPGERSETQRPETRREDALAARLRPTVTTATEAQLLPTTRLLLPKGAFIDCTLETAIDSTLPGMTTCVIAADTFSADGKVVLFERGTKLVGETHGQVQQGQARVFVLWTEARTPTGVVVALDSPGSDELGRAGLPGEVERHFWQRFGAAMLLSVLNGAVQAGVQSAATRNGGAVIYAPSASQDVLAEVLRGTLQIAPTVVKRNGDRIQVLVARDLDFRSVYELRTPAGR